MNDRARLAWRRLAVTAALFVGLLALFLATTQTVPGSEDEVSEQFADLLKLVSGQQETAERLVAHEHTLDPHASRESCIERAVQGLLRDRDAQHWLPMPNLLILELELVQGICQQFEATIF